MESELDQLHVSVDRVTRRQTWQTILLGLGAVFLAASLTLNIVQATAQNKRSCRAQVTQEWNDLIEDVIVASVHRDDKALERATHKLEVRPSQGDLVKERCK